MNSSEPSTSKRVSTDSGNEETEDSIIETDSSLFDALTKKDPKKLTPRDKVILEGGPDLYPIKSLPTPGTIVYAKSIGSAYWPALVGPIRENLNGPQANHVIFLEEAFRIDFVPLNRIIPYKLNSPGGGQKQLIEKLNRVEVKSASKLVLWEKSFALAVEFQNIPLYERLSERIRRRTEYLAHKEQNKKPRKKGAKLTDKSKDSVPENHNSKPQSKENPGRKSEHYGLRKKIHPPVLGQSFAKYASRHNSDHQQDEIPSTSAGAKIKKSDPGPKVGAELETYVKERYARMDKSFKPSSVDSIICSSCAQTVTPLSIVSCHSMPFHRECVKMLQVPNENGGVKLKAVCLDCELKRCFVCKMNQSSELSEPVKCSKCELYFHRKCLLDNWPQAEIQGTTGPIICPIHCCHTCKFEHKVNGNARSYASKKGDSLRCVLCLATYHKNTCIPAGTGGTVMLSEYMICPRHRELYPQDTNKCRKLGCIMCSKRVKEKDPIVVCSLCPRVWHKACAGTPADVELDSNFKCDTCTWGGFPVYGDVVWYQQPGLAFWPALILYQKGDQARSAVRNDHRYFSILYCGPKPQYYDNCHVTRSLPLLVGDQELLKQLNLHNKPAAVSAYDEALILTNLSETYRKSKLAQPKPIYRSVEKNQYRMKCQPMSNVADDPCTCGRDKDAKTVCTSESGCYNRSMSIECSDKNCSGGARCVNRFFSGKSEHESDLEPFVKSGMGFGLRCKKTISEGDFISEYRGEVISFAEKQRRLELHKEPDPLYLLELEHQHSYLDAEFYGNPSRLINHSCSPNCKTEKYISASGRRVIGIFATRRIDVGEEITFFYGANYMKHCRCGSVNCKSLPVTKQKENRAPASLTDDSNWDNQCAVCKLDGDKLLMCDYPQCRKVYHFKCVGLSKSPRGFYHCPLHTSYSKSKSKKQTQDLLASKVAHKRHAPYQVPKRRSLSVAPQSHRPPLVDSNPISQPLIPRVPDESMIEETTEDKLENFEISMEPAADSGCATSSAQSNLDSPSSSQSVSGRSYGLRTSISCLVLSRAHKPEQPKPSPVKSKEVEISKSTARRLKDCIGSALADTLTSIIGAIGTHNPDEKANKMRNNPSLTGFDVSETSQERFSAPEGGKDLLASDQMLPSVRLDLTPIKHNNLAETKQPEKKKARVSIDFDSVPAPTPPRFTPSRSKSANAGDRCSGLNSYTPWNPKTIVNSRVRAPGHQPCPTAPTAPGQTLRIEPGPGPSSRMPVVPQETSVKPDTTVNKTGNNTGTRSTTPKTSRKARGMLRPSKSAVALEAVRSRPERRRPLYNAGDARFQHQINGKVYSRQELGMLESKRMKEDFWALSYNNEANPHRNPNGVARTVKNGESKLTKASRGTKLQNNVSAREDEVSSNRSKSVAQRKSTRLTRSSLIVSLGTSVAGSIFGTPK